MGYRRLRTDLLDCGVTDGDIRLRQLIKVVLAKENDSLQTALLDSADKAFSVWNGAQVVRERHYDHQQTGDPLTVEDFSFDAGSAGSRFPRPS